MADYYIVLDHPHRVFRPGDAVTGLVVLAVKRPIVNIAVLLLVGGLVRALGSNMSTKKARLFSVEMDLYGGDSSSLSKGEHRFPFQILLPRKNIHSSIRFEKGSVSYLLKSRLKVHNKDAVDTLATCEKNVTIQTPLDVARLPIPKASVLVIRKPQKKFLKMPTSLAALVRSGGSSGSTGSRDEDSGRSLPGSLFKTPQAITMSVSTPQAGYLPNEVIPVRVALQHVRSAKSPHGIIITLIRICKIALGDGGIQSFRKDLAQTVKPLYLDPSSLDFEVTTNIKVPQDAFATLRGAPLLSFEYFVEVVANLSSRSYSVSFEEGEEDRENAGFVNVDRMKRLKNVVCVSRRIVIGTERGELSSEAEHSLANSSASEDNTSPVQAQSTPSIVPERSLSHGDVFESSDPAINGHYRGLSSNSNGSASLVPSSPPPLDTALSPSAPPLPPPPITYQELANTEVSEKQALRMHEESLLPSEPPMEFHSSETDAIDIPVGDMGRAVEGNEAPEYDRDNFLEREVTDFVPVYEENRNRS